MIGHQQAFWLTAAMHLAAIGCLAEESHQAVRNRFTATPEGGSFAVSDSVTVTIPAGALDKETELEFHILGSSELSEIFSNMTADSLLVGVDAKPDGLVFAEPITISFSNVPLEPWDNLFVYQFEAGAKAHLPAAVELAYSLTEGTVDLFLTHFSGSAAARYGPSDDASREEAKKKCLADCRCVKVKVKQRDREVMCNTVDCQLLETELKVWFPKCPNAPPETHYVRELTPGCHLGLELSSAKSTIEQGETTDVTAMTHLGCPLHPLEGETTTFSSSPLGIVRPSNVETGMDGTAKTVFEAGDEDGVPTVTAKTTVTYPMKEMVATHAHPDIPGGTFTESFVGTERTETVQEQTDITIRTPETWHVQGTATTSYSRHAPGGYYWVEWSVSGEASVSFSFDLDRAAVLAGEPLELITTGMGTQTAGAIIDFFDPSIYSSASITNGYFPSTLTFDSVELTGWADEDGDVALYVLACVNADTSACCDGDIYHYDVNVCSTGTSSCYDDVARTKDSGTSCIAFGFGTPVKVVEGTHDGLGAFYGNTYNGTSSYSITFTKE